MFMVYKYLIIYTGRSLDGTFAQYPNGDGRQIIRKRKDEAHLLKW